MRPSDHETAKLVEHVWRTNVQGSSVVILRNGNILDVSARFPTMTDLLNADIVDAIDEEERRDLRIEPLLRQIA